MQKPKITMSTRQVTARFWDNEELAILEDECGVPDLRLTMIGLWGLSDEAGIFEWRPSILASKIYPVQPKKQLTVEPGLAVMLRAGFVKQVEVDGQRYGVWPNWGSHNNFRQKNSRYPAVEAYLNPGQSTQLRETPAGGTSPPETPAYPVEREKEREVEREREQELERERESEQAIPTVLPEVIPNEQKLPVERLANRLFKLLDEPKDQLQHATTWCRQVAALLRAKHTEEEIASVMDFAVHQNDWSAEYLTIAKAPMASFVKDYDNLFKRWKAQQKGAAAAANRAKLETPTAPGAHGNVAREGKIQL